MKHLFALYLLAIVSWYAPEFYPSGNMILLDDMADIIYTPAVSTSPYGPWTDYPATVLLWATLPDPGPGKTLYYSCRASLSGESSGYAQPLSLTRPKNGRGKNR